MKNKQLTRIIRFYKIKSRPESYMGLNAGSHIKLTWQEKFVDNPDNPYHFNHAAGWKRRQATISYSELYCKYSKIPPL